MAEDIKALDGVYSFSDARRVVAEVLAIQVEALDTAETEEMREFLNVRKAIVQATLLVLTDEEHMQHYLRRADEREDAGRA